MEKKQLESIAAKVRIDVIRAIHNAASGHPGGSLSAADLVTALYFSEMNIDPADPKKADRDKFILSKGHAGPVQYAALAERGYFPVSDMMRLRKLGSNFQGHPNMHKVPGIEMSTGSLGQGISVSVGMALANKMDGNPGRVYTLLGDGELQEGLVFEAVMSAAHYKLDNMVAIVDFNGLQIDGKNDDVMSLGDLAAKLRAFGFDLIELADGNDLDQVLAALNTPAVPGKPRAILAHTVKGKGVSFMENQAGWHGKAPSAQEREQALKELEG